MSGVTVMETLFSLNLGVVGAGGLIGTVGTLITVARLAPLPAEPTGVTSSPPSFKISSFCFFKSGLIALGTLYNTIGNVINHS